MLIRVKNSYRRTVDEALKSHHYLPACRITSLYEYNGRVIDVEPEDAKELVEELEDLGFQCHPEDDLA
jgi:DNA-directed RNA polymerase subunit F